MKEPFHQERLLTAAECDAIIELWNEDHGHGSAYSESETYISKRTTIVELPTKIHAKILKAVTRANKALWGYAGAYSEYHEIYRYTPGDFFDWHMDLGADELAKRKVTTLVQLTDPRKYQGGELELFANETHTAGKRRGTLMIYPSYIMHRVTEVTGGMRFSLGGEILGPAFR